MQTVAHRKMKRTFRHKNSHGREVALQGLYQSEIGGHSISQILRQVFQEQPAKHQGIPHDLSTSGS